MKRRILTTLAVAALTLAGSLGLTHLSSAHAASSLTIKGSDTMVILGQAWAEAYMKSHPEVNISVQGGGSGTGIAALIQGTCDICEASRHMKSKEISQCKERNIQPVATTVALDGLSIAVNKDNPVKNLTMAQLKDIYTGKVTNWRQVDGNNAPIVVLSRESSSGTYALIQELVLHGQRYSSSALFMPSTKAIQAEITNNRNAIGYGGYAYFDGKRNVKIVPVAAAAGKPAIMPTDANVQSGKYPLARPLLLYTAGKPKGVIGQFIQFCLSAEGQKIVTTTGYTPLK